MLYYRRFRLVPALFPSLSPRLLCTVWLTLLLAILPATAADLTTRVTFLLVNDIYSMGDAPGPDGVRRGGFPRLAAVVKAERAKGGHVLFAHAGDTLSPSLMSGLDHGAHIIALTNLIPPDIFVPGNHEFDFGKANFLTRIGEAKFPLYAANLRGPDGAPIAGFKDQAIVEFDGVRIGLTGATYDDTKRASSPEDLRFGPTVATVKEQGAALRRAGADFVVAVVHADRPQDDELAESRAADLILSGHDHDLRIGYDERVALVESSYDARYVVAVDVEITIKEEGGKRRVAWWPQFRVIDTANVTPDPEVGAVVARYEAILSNQMDRPIGTLKAPLDSRNVIVRTQEAAIGNLIADAMRQRTGADVAIMNGGGIRAGKIYAAGTQLTRRDILAELPFGNRIVVVEVTGAALRAALENGLASTPIGGGRFPQVSGLRLELDRNRPPGARLLSISVNGAPLDAARLYKVATNDFLARGGDGYVQFRDAARILPDSDAPLVASEVMTYVESLGELKADVDGRIVIK